MTSFFAAVFPDLKTAEEAQRLLEKFDDDKLLTLVSSAVIVKGEDGRVARHTRKAPGPLAAGLGGVVGGLLGLVAGPFGGIVGAASGALSGGWFDLIKVEERESFQDEVARSITANRAALIGEVLNPSEEAKRTVEARFAEMGGVMIGTGEMEEVMTGTRS